MAINWDEIETKYQKKYKDYAKAGQYKLKCTGVEAKEVVGKDNVVFKFSFAETETEQFPTADEWFSYSKDGWRIHHAKCLFMVLGLNETQARSAVEKAEEKNGKSNQVKTYEALFNTLLKKQPEVDVEVVAPDERHKYSWSRFTNPLVLMKDSKKKQDDTDTANDAIASVLDEGETITENDLPW